MLPLHHTAFAIVSHSWEDTLEHDPVASRVESIRGRFAATPGSADTLMPDCVILDELFVKWLILIGLTITNPSQNS